MKLFFVMHFFAVTPSLDPSHVHFVGDQVFWNDELVGKTTHINDTLDPVWDLEIFAFKVDEDGPNSVEQSTLRVVCLDWDQFGSNDVLGQIELTGSQIKQLVESKDGDEGPDTDEQAMGEADMERIFVFVQMFQEHEMDEAGLGKMIVGVPQDPSIKSQQHDANLVDEDVEVAEAASKKKKRHKKKKKGGAPEAEEVSQRRPHEGEGAAENKEGEESHAQVLSSGAEAARCGDEPQPNVEEQKSQRAEANGNQEGARAAEVAAATTSAAVEAALLVGGTEDEDSAREGGRQREEHHDEAKQNEELERPPLGEPRQVDGGVAPGESRNAECRNAEVPGGEDNPASDDTKVSFDVLNVDTLGEKTETHTINESTLDAGGLLPAPDHMASVAPGGDADTSGVPPNIATTITVGVSNTIGHETGAGDSVCSEGLTPGVPREGKTTLESNTNKEDQLAKDVAADHAPKETTNAGAGERGSRVVGVSAKAEPRASRKRKKATRDSTTFRYRDGETVILFLPFKSLLTDFVNLSHTAHPPPSSSNK